jgi:hypothetical protein
MNAKGAINSLLKPHHGLINEIKGATWHESNE